MVSYDLVTYSMSLKFTPYSRTSDKRLQASAVLSSQPKLLACEGIPRFSALFLRIDSAIESIDAAMCLVNVLLSCHDAVSIEVESSVPRPVRRPTIDDPGGSGLAWRARADLL